MLLRRAVLGAAECRRCSLPARTFWATPALQAQPPAALLELRSLEQVAHHALARAWADAFVLDDIPKDAYSVSYTRSSGPGGQHVNKTNSKAVVRCDVHRATGVWLPPFVVPALTKSSYYHAPDLLLSSQTSRSAPQNLARALENLHSTILEAAKELIQGETSEAQKERVKQLAKADKRRQREMKDRQKSRKDSRRKDKWD